ncbi:MEI2-like protein 4 isoform X1, partial [Tanacetum coccineum]
MPSSLQNQLKFHDFRSTPNYHPHSLPEYQDGLTNSILSNSPSNLAARMSERLGNRQFNRIGGSMGRSIDLNDNAFGHSGNANGSPVNHHYMWNHSHHQPQPHNMMWPNSPSLMNGVSNAHSLPRGPSHMANTFMHINNHHVGSAPSVNPSIWDRRQSYAGESPDTSVFHPGSLGNMRVPGSSPHPLDFVSHNIFPRMGDLPIPSKNIGLASHHQNSVMFPSRGQMIPMMTSFDSPSDRSRNRRNEAASNQSDNKKQFELDLDRIMRGDDRRTTLMIKNIPNKYTSKMLLAAIDERHRGTYDFIYLPIDFKASGFPNKCNVGYAFINMTEPPLIVPFFQAFNGKKWEKFNSEKVASLA